MANTLSPIFSLFIAPSGKLYLKVQHLLGRDELVQSSNPPYLKRRRPGPKHPNYGIPDDLWPLIMHRVAEEQKEPLRTVAADYGVSHETIRRIMFNSSVYSKKHGCVVTVLRRKHFALQASSAHNKRSTAGRYIDG